MRFGLTSEALPSHLLGEDYASGALVTFMGRVRETNEGQSVLSLQYEAYEELALSEGERVLIEALGRFPIQSAACLHRTGLLNLGEAAIIVEVSAKHRREAFDACAWIVDEVKARVPIWKKEFYAAGESQWIDPTVQVIKSEEPIQLEVVPRDLSSYRVVDIREADELEAEPLPISGADWMPLSRWSETALDDCPTLFVCHAGVRSLDLTSYLRQRGWRNVFSLPGGISTLRCLMK